MSLSPRRRRWAAAGGLPGIAAPLHILAAIPIIFAAPGAPVVFAAANLPYVRDKPALGPRSSAGCAEPAFRAAAHDSSESRQIIPLTSSALHVIGIERDGNRWPVLKFFF